MVKRSPTLGTLVSTKTKCIKQIFIGKITLVPVAFLMALSIVQRRSSEKKGISMLRPIRLRIYEYAHLNVRYIDLSAWPLTRHGNLRLVVCVCAV